MPFQPVILITDALFFLLTAVLIGFVLMIRTRPHLKRPWQKVIQRGTGAVSLCVLLTYYAVALLDSMHFHPRLATQVSAEYQYSNEIISVLDVLMTPMRTQVEKTFSAPLSAYSFAKEMIQYDDGRVDHIYPRLKYGGAHLSDPATEKFADLRRLLIKGIGIGILGWGLILCSIILLTAACSGKGLKQQLYSVFKRDSNYPVGALTLTLALISVLIAVSMVIGSQYHLFGTDKVGQDVFYQAIKSIRTGVLIGALTTLVMLPVAIILGSMAGFFRGWVDDVIQYIYTTWNSIPNVLLIATETFLF